MWETIGLVLVLLGVVSLAFLFGVIAGFWIAHEPVEPMRRRPF